MNMKVLFICSLNIQRSKTAEHLFKDKFETKSAGMYNETPVTAEQLAWADIILVMEEQHKIELSKRFPKLKKKVICLDIPDMYLYKDPELIAILKRKVNSLMDRF